MYRAWDMLHLPLGGAAFHPKRIVILSEAKDLCMNFTEAAEKADAATVLG
jgi:hypothetical protein